MSPPVRAETSGAIQERTIQQHLAQTFQEVPATQSKDIFEHDISTWAC